MIHVVISPDGVRRVSFEGHDPMEDPVLCLWPVINRELIRLNREVRRESSRLVKRGGNIL